MKEERRAKEPATTAEEVKDALEALPVVLCRLLLSLDALSKTQKSRELTPEVVAQVVLELHERLQHLFSGEALPAKWPKIGGPTTDTLGSVLSETPAIGKLPQRVLDSLRDLLRDRDDEQATRLEDEHLSETDVLRALATAEWTLQGLLPWTRFARVQDAKQKIHEDLDAGIRRYAAQLAKASKQLSPRVHIAPLARRPPVHGQKRPYTPRGKFTVAAAELLARNGVSKADIVSFIARCEQGPASLRDKKKTVMLRLDRRNRRNRKGT